MISARITTLGLVKIKVSWKKGYDIKIFVYDVTNKILSRESNYIVDVIICNSSIPVRKVITVSILRVALVR